MPPRRTLAELETLALRMGYPSYKDMLYELYVVQEKTLVEIAAMCHVYWKRTRKHCIRFGIEIKERGRTSRRTKIVVTDALVQEVTRDGVPAVAARLGITDTVLRHRLNEYVNKKPKP